MLSPRTTTASRLQKLEAKFGHGTTTRVFDPRKLRAIAKKYHLDLIVLFGSHAKGRANGNSDIDLAVRARDYRKTFGRSCREFALAGELADAVNGPGEVDLVMLNRADSLLLRNVANDGIVLYERTPASWVEFVSYANRRYYDDERFRRYEAELLRTRYP